jgi:enoyl-CoA hydratase/carnithine racemase
MGETLVSLEDRDGVILAELRNGMTNPIGPPLVDALTRAAQSVVDDAAAGALVLTSANTKFFSIGFDIPHLIDLPREAFLEFFTSFSRLSLALLTLPKPTVAAIPGHATAGGCILALCCDYRFIAQGRKLMGLNEIRLGVPVPFAADCILRSLVGQRAAREITDGGQFYLPEQAQALGLVDYVAPGDELIERSIQQARTLAEMPREAFAQIKANRLAPVRAEIKAGLSQKDLEFVEAWYSPEARQRLQEAVARF